MATEGPFIRDGAQTMAAANYYNPSTPLPGPNGSGQFLWVAQTAARTVAIVATQGAAAYGILQNAPAAGQAADVAILGVTKAVAGAAVAGGAQVMSDSQGRTIPWTSTNAALGVAIESATAAGQIFTVAIGPLPN